MRGRGHGARRAPARSARTRARKNVLAIRQRPYCSPSSSPIEDSSFEPTVTLKRGPTKTSATREAKPTAIPAGGEEPRAADLPGLPACLTVLPCALFSITLVTATSLDHCEIPRDPSRTARPVPGERIVPEEQRRWRGARCGEDRRPSLPPSRLAPGRCRRRSRRERRGGEVRVRREIERQHQAEVRWTEEGGPRRPCSGAVGSMVSFSMGLVREGRVVARRIGAVVAGAIDGERLRGRAGRPGSRSASRPRRIHRRPRNPDEGGAPLDVFTVGRSRRRRDRRSPGREGTGGRGRGARPRLRRARGCR